MPLLIFMKSNQVNTYNNSEITNQMENKEKLLIKIANSILIFAYFFIMIRKLRLKMIDF